MREGLRILLAAAVLTTLTVLGGVLLGGPAREAPRTDTPSAGPTAIDDGGALTGLEVRRAAFCPAVPETAAATALGGAVATTDSYDSGQRTQLTQQVRDVVHEFGCTWRSGKASARAWVFAPPVSRDRARSLVQAAVQRDGCTRADAPEYGSPGVALQCERGGRTEVSHRGLFGDAWLTCTLLPSVADDADPADLTVRAGRWCAAVATAAAGDPVAG